MAKKSMIEREKKREKLVAKYAEKRAALKEIANDESRPMEERFKARLKLAKLPRNSSATRLHNRCQLNRASARLLPQTESLADRPAGSWLERPDPRHGEVELVRRAMI